MSPDHTTSIQIREIRDDVAELKKAVEGIVDRAKSRDDKITSLGTELNDIKVALKGNDYVDGLLSEMKNFKKDVTKELHTLNIRLAMWMGGSVVAGLLVSIVLKQLKLI